MVEDWDGSHIEGMGLYIVRGSEAASVLDETTA